MPDTYAKLYVMVIKSNKFKRNMIKTEGQVVRTKLQCSKYKKDYNSLKIIVSVSPTYAHYNCIISPLIMP